MRSQLISLLLTLVIINFTATAQDAFIEIPLDDFPIFVEGFRIQTGAFSMEETARAWCDSLGGIFDDDVNLKYENHLWRVRIGAFEDRSTAERFLEEEIRPAGFGDATLTVDKVHRESKSDAEHPMVNGFRIQINALSSRAEALELGRRLDFNYKDMRAYVLQQDSIYRVQFGDFLNRGDAERWLNNLKEDNVSPVWIVPTSVYQVPPPSPIERPEADPFDYMD